MDCFRFRQDGIERIPTVDAREGVIPFSPLGTEFVRHSILLRKFLPSSSPFPNETLTALERVNISTLQLVFHLLIVEKILKVMFKINNKKKALKTEKLLFLTDRIGLFRPLGQPVFLNFEKY